MVTLRYDWSSFIAETFFICPDFLFRIKRSSNQHTQNWKTRWLTFRTLKVFQKIGVHWDLRTRANVTDGMGKFDRFTYIILTGESMISVFYSYWESRTSCYQIIFLNCSSLNHFWKTFKCITKTNMTTNN